MNNFINLHPGVGSFFNETVRSGKLGHAYLLYGYEGIGKEAFVFNMVNRLLCETNTFDICGECAACKQFSKLWHPDFHYIFPLPGKTHFKESDITEAVHEKSVNPFIRLKISGQADFIGIQAIRALKKELYMEPQQGQYRVALIQDIDNMRQEAANSLLKILEEPPPHVIFFLTTSRISRILPTVLSRCQVIHFEKPEPALILDKLAPLIPEGEKNAFSQALRFSNLNIKKAFELIDGKFSDVIEPVEESVLAFLHNEPLPGLNAFRSIANLNSRESIGVALELLTSYMHDLLIQACHLNIPVQNDTFIKEHVISHTFPLSEELLTTIIDLILRTRDTIMADYNFNPHLLLEKLFQDIFKNRRLIEGVQHAS